MVAKKSPAEVRREAMKKVEKRRTARDEAKLSRKYTDKRVQEAVRALQKEGVKKQKGESDRAFASRKRGFRAAVRQKGKALTKTRRATNKILKEKALHGLKKKYF